jgi:hypothetical protein
MTADEEKKQQLRPQRKEVQTKVEFFVDGDIETAKSADISESGMRFITEKPIKFRMRLNLDGEIKEYLALLVWARKDPEGSTSYGFQFIPDDDECVF